MSIGHTYQTVREFLMPRQMARLITRIENSGRFFIEGGDNPPRLPSHIYIKETGDCVGYLGDESVEIADPHRKDTKPYRRELRILFNAV